MRGLLIFIQFITLLTATACGQGSGPDTGAETNQSLGNTSRIGAFNIQSFGQTKMKNADVVSHLTGIIRRYDIILIQEIRDVSETAIYELLNRVNQYPPATYQLVLSERAGRTSYKEQYAFIYRSDRVTVLNTYMYDDGAEPDRDQFEREPFVAYIEINNLTVSLIAIHVKPNEALDEINNLPLVYEDAISKNNDLDAIILGDLNADCTYLNAKEQQTNALISDDRFTWLTSFELDTTTRHSTDCAYDHLVITNSIQDHFIVNSSSVYRYDIQLNLAETQALEVSDHFPVEATLQ
ncbi:MAG: endonuclease/exonuclease/phosphatase family protein [Gammaproteobacteria bacterium]|nr:endonuclease/exonuclease/phosphatase family protein [Gammaproteobacteria bacterium]